MSQNLENQERFMSVKEFHSLLKDEFGSNAPGLTKVYDLARQIPHVELGSRLLLSRRDAVEFLRAKGVSGAY